MSIKYKNKLKRLIVVEPRNLEEQAIKLSW